MRLDSSRVALLAQNNYQPSELDQAIDRVLAAIGPLPGLRSSRVLLKPNLITTRNAQLACTEARFIVAAARWFLDQGAMVAVGDSPSFGSARSVLDKIWALAALEALGVPVVEFRQATTVTLPSGQQAQLATAALDCDLLVNLPRVKAHAQMRVTLAVKNCFGCLAGWHKPWWHMAHGGNNPRFPDLLVELLSALPPTLTLVDGIVAMHRTGPVHGEPFPLGLVAAGSNPVAIDTALLGILGVDPGCSPLWQASDRAGLPGTRLEQLTFPLAAPADWGVTGFIAPDELSPIRFNPFRFCKNSVKRILLRLFAR